MKRATRVLLLPVILAPSPAWATDWELRTVQTVNHQLASPVADSVATFLTNPLVTGGSVLLVAAGGSPRYYETAATGLVAEGVGVGIAEGLKIVTNRPRPYLVDPTLRTPAGREPDSSFPSGHTTVAFAAATVVALDRPNLAPWSLGFATLVGFSRIYEGVHYPTDVLAAAALGALTAGGVVWGRNYLQSRGWLPVPPDDHSLAAASLTPPAGELAPPVVLFARHF